jgi:hypothetical protein
MKRIAILTALILAAVSAFGQAARVDLPLLTAGPSVPISGGPLPQALWVANAAAYLCTHPSATLVACQAAPITTYTDSTEGTTCPTATPLVQLPGNTCTASTGTAANVGFWYGGGVFDYWIVSSYGTYGPFSGNSSNSALPSSCGNPTGIPCGGTGATTVAGAWANIFSGAGIASNCALLQNVSGTLTCTATTAAGALANLGGAAISGAAFTGPIRAPIVNGIYAASNFGVKCDGITDDSSALNAIGTFAATQTSAGNTVTVEFPSNATCVQASEITTWLVESLHIHGNGSLLKFTGTGTSTNGQIYLHGSANEIDNLELSGLVLQGNANSTWGVYQDNGILAHSIIDLLNVQDQNTGCFYMADFEISRKANFICSSILAQTMGVVQTTRPKYGLIAGDPTAFHAGYFANNAVVNLTIEGPSLIGLWCKHCTVSNHFFGTTEDVSSSGGTVGVGVQDYGTAADGESSGNTFEMDSEANVVSDINAGGFGDVFQNSVVNNFTAIVNGFGTIIGGVYNNITLAAGHGAWTLIGPTYNSTQNGGTFLDATPSLTTTMFMQNRISWPVPDPSNFPVNSESVTTPAVSCQSGSGYTITASISSITLGKRVDIAAKITVTTLGTCGTSLTFAAPWTENSTYLGAVTCFNSGNNQMGYMEIAGSTAYVTRYDGGNLASANGQVIVCATRPMMQ